MTIKEGFEKIRKRAEQLEKEGVCLLWSNAESSLGIDWTLSTGEDFVKASGLAHMIENWSDSMDCEYGNTYYRQAGQTPNGWGTWQITVSCIWL